MRIEILRQKRSPDLFLSLRGFDARTIELIAFVRGSCWRMVGAEFGLTVIRLLKRLLVGWSCVTERLEEN